jgi:vesicle-fusing ATPase
MLSLLSSCSNSTLTVYQAQVQDRYTKHRATRNDQQKAKMLAKDFIGVNIDPILLRLTDPTIEPGYQDPRHCLVFWARPTQKVKDLILRVQKELLTVAPSKKAERSFK